MATPVGRIEKEILMMTLHEQKIPVVYMKDGHEYLFALEQPVGEEMVFRPNKPLGKLKARTKLPLLFNYREQAVNFSVELIAQQDELLFCKPPQILYKDLDRNYLRVDTPSDLKVIFTFKGDRYNLAFPKVTEHENFDSDDAVRNLDPHNLAGLVKQITGTLKDFADGYKIVNFKDKKPEILEEKIVSETGKTLFIPSTAGLLPKTDPYPRKRLITEDIFKRYLETTGVGKTFLDDTCRRFLKKKTEAGIYSDAWVPFLFQEYVVGYIHVWIDKQERPSFDFSVLDHVYEFAKVLAFSLKENGYFEHGRVQGESFEGRVLDISASGLLFACPLGSSLLTTLLVDAELTVIIEAPDRTINVTTRIVRRFKDASAGYFGCRFINMAPEDTRFLFEHLYGRQIDDSDSAFFTGQV